MADPDHRRSGSGADATCTRRSSSTSATTSGSSSRTHQVTGDGDPASPPSRTPARQRRARRTVGGDLTARPPSTCSTTSTPPARTSTRCRRHLHLLHRPRRATRSAINSVHTRQRSARCGRRRRPRSASRPRSSTAINTLGRRHRVAWRRSRTPSSFGEPTATTRIAQPGRRAQRRRRRRHAGPSCRRPAAADLPTLAEQDVIRTAFIYKPADGRAASVRSRDAGRRAGVRQRPRAAGPGVQAGRRAERRRAFARHRQPLQVQGLRRRRRHRPGQRQPATGSPGRARSATFADQFADRARHRRGLPDR